ncbi:MAG: glycosyltransferase family 2 protein [Polyangiaceae bacterium]
MPEIDLPLVTIGIPCLNEERFIEKCVADALAQDYPADRIEVVVADGGSSDRTREILDELSAREPRLRWVDNPERIQAAAMNEIIRSAKGDVLVRLDAHCEYAANYVSKCIEALQETGAMNAGGSQRARADNWFQRALCAAMESRLGVGGASYKDASKSGFVDTVFCGAFRREVFEQVGMYDPRAITNEDAELNQRILEAGGKIYLSAEIEAYYYPRDSFRSLSKQYFKYGTGRARTLLKRGRFPRISPALPFLMTMGGAVLLLTRPHKPSTWFAFGAYAALTGLEAVRVGRKVGPWAVPVVWGIFPTLHVSHGLGFAYGLLRYARNPDWTDPELLPPRSQYAGSGGSV